MSKQRMRAPARPGRLAALAAMPVLFLLMLALLPSEDRHPAEAMYLVDDSDYVQVEEVSAEVFLTDASAKLISKVDGGVLLLSPGIEATVRYQDRTITTVTEEETVNALLTRLSIRPSPLEMAAISGEGDAMEIVVDSQFIFYERNTAPIPHEVIYRDVPDKYAWEETVVQEGRDGEHTEIYEIIYQDGREMSRQLIEVTDTEPEPTIIERGTIENFADNKEPVASITTNEDGTGTITLENGAVLTFHDVRSMRATAYSSEEPTVGTRTASGTTVRVGVVAVDRSVIPLGSKVYVVTNDSRYGIYVYGFAVAEDTGVRGRIIDLYMDTLDECVRFGVRDCTVYILD